MPTDSFALLHEPRRPWIDVDALKGRFLRLSAEVHPDRFHQATDCERESATQAYASLNAAYNTLREPRDRLLHLLELESGAKPRDIQKIPPGTMDLFVEIGQTCRDVDDFLAKRAEVTSPMLKVQQFARGQEWVAKLQTLQRTVNQRRDDLGRELLTLNEAWAAADNLPAEHRQQSLSPHFERLEQIYRILSYVARWTEQLQQRMVELAST